MNTPTTIKPEYQSGFGNEFATEALPGALPEALNAHQRSVELIPEDPEAYNNLGNTLQELGRLEEAQASLKEAKKAPGSPTTRVKHSVVTRCCGL